jgi:hypothetical protein
LVAAGLALMVAGCGDAGPNREAVGSSASAITFPNDGPAYTFFVGKGLTSFQAAGIVGNLDQESSDDPTAIQYGGGPGRGIAQWSVGGRWDTGSSDNATWYASTKGLGLWTLDLQLDFIWYELTTFPAYGLSALEATTNVTDATIAFMTDFEICGTCDSSQRVTYAKTVLAAFGSTPPADAGSPAPDTGTPCVETMTGAAGVCMNTTECASLGGAATAGYCPGPADIQCCTGFDAGSPHDAGTTGTMDAGTPGKPPPMMPDAGTARADAGAEPASRDGGGEAAATGPFDPTFHHSAGGCSLTPSGSSGSGGWTALLALTSMMHLRRRRLFGALAPSGHVSTRKPLDFAPPGSKVCGLRGGSRPTSPRDPDYGRGFAAMLWTRELRVAFFATFIALGASCSPNGPSQPVTSDPLVCPTTSADALDTKSVEWVSYHTEVPFAPGDFHALVAGLIGPAAQSGKFVTHQEVTPGVFIEAAADPTTPEQSRITLSFDDGTSTPRRIALVPASFAVGSVYLTTIDAAIATMQSEEKQQKGSSESFLIQYEVTSSMGGTFSFGVHGVTGVFTLVIDVSSPTTNLAQGKIGSPALSATAYDTVNGTVWFHLSKDDFDYFVDHAYGQDATAAQNFKDFALEPHRWLRLTVTPHLTDKYVDVAFDVLGAGGSRTPLAKAPASILAGSLFQSLVDRNMTTMLAQEAAKPGSSTPWTAPFYYDAPNGGGVVQVIAQGQAGVFQIAYAVAAPHHTVKDVPFLPYKPVTITPPNPKETAACDKLGNPGIIAAPEGAFEITFTASSVVKTSPDLHGPLVGDLDCSVFKAADVTVEGPKNGAKSVQDFTVPNADLSSPTAPTFLTNMFPDGNYQVL